MKDIPDSVTMGDREVKIEITMNPQTIGAYDPIQNVIFLRDILHDYPELEEYVFKHELEHARYPKGIFRHTWIDLRTFFTLPWRFRKQMRKILSLHKYWRTMIANISLSFLVLGILIGPALLLIKIIELLI